MVMHCACNLRESECSYPKCHNGEEDKDITLVDEVAEEIASLRQQLAEAQSTEPAVQYERGFSDAVKIAVGVCDSYISRTMQNRHLVNDDSILMERAKAAHYIRSELVNIDWRKP